MNMFFRIIMRILGLIMIFMSNLAAQPVSDTLWTTTLGGAGEDVGKAICATPDGGYLIAGYTTTNSYGDRDVYYAKLDSVGNVQWEGSCGFGGRDEGHAVLSVPSGGYLIVGSGGSEGYLIRLSDSGDTLWTRVGSPPDIGHHEFDAADLAWDSGFICSGRATGNYVGLICKIDTVGHYFWAHTYGSPNTALHAIMDCTPKTGQF